MKYRLFKKQKRKNSLYLSELFYCFSGITQQGKCVYLPPVTDQVTRALAESQDCCFICENLFASGIQPPFREKYSQSPAPKVSQSVLLPGITNLAFPQFRLLAAVLEWKMALLEWKMALMLGSMAARNG
jgi:hypothetical protein